jgi:hypothetical protein
MLFVFRSILNVSHVDAVDDDDNDDVTFIVSQVIIYLVHFLVLEVHFVNNFIYLFPETEKYAHVTFFFNGGVEAKFDLEDRKLVPSPKVPTYDLQPTMSSVGVADEVRNQPFFVLLSQVMGLTPIILQDKNIK